jgi:hypothetical protein
MPESDLVQAAPAVVAGKGLAVRGLWEVFTRPTAFFAELIRSPKILVPYLLIGIMALVFFMFTADMIFQLQVSHPKFQEQMAQNPEMTPERMRGFMVPSIIGFGVIALLLSPLIIAALATFWGNFVFAGKATFKQVLSVSLYGEVLYCFGEILLLPLLFAKGEFTVSYSLAALVANLGVDHPAYVALSKLSVFHVWEIIVLAIGYSMLFGFSKGKGYGTALLSAGFLAVFHILWTLIFS